MHCGDADVCGDHCDDDGNDGDGFWDQRLTLICYQDIKKLWQDEAIQKVFLKGGEFHLPEVTK